MQLLHKMRQQTSRYIHRCTAFKQSRAEQREREKGVSVAEMEEEDIVQVIGIRASPFVVRVLVALTAKSIEYQIVEENPQQKSELLLRSNPVYKKYPVLIHRGRPVCESLLILEYIDELWPGDEAAALLPKHPYDRALARFWAAYVDDKLVASLRRILTLDGGGGDAALAEAQGHMGVLEEALAAAGSQFFGGHRMGLVDVALGSLWSTVRALERLRAVDLVNHCRTPLLHAWFLRFSASPVVQGLLPDPDSVAHWYRSKFGSQ